jgi:large subunit ribosomal protein L21
MYAVIKTGGKQYRVSAGDKIKIETLAAEVGASVTLTDVLLVGAGSEVKVGTPRLEGAEVTATVVSKGRGDKVTIFKMRRRKHYIRHQGHRQNFSEVFINTISDGAGNKVEAEGKPVIATAPDDLAKIEGIGPKIANVLAKNGITTFAQLAKTEPQALTDMLKAAGGRFNIARTETWPQQAELAAKGDWVAFKELTDELVGGVKK